MSLTKLVVTLSLLACVACGASTFDPAGEDTDQVSDHDGGDGDGGPGDASGDDDGDDAGGDAPGDSSPSDDDPNYPLDGFGLIGDDCPSILADMLTSTDPSMVRVSIDFLADPFDRNVDGPELTAGGQAVLESSPGSAGTSEALAYELLARCDGAALEKLEGEIGYGVGAKRSDFSVLFGATTIGVQVVRAVTYPPTEPYEVEDATPVITDRLEDILLASADVDPEDAWTKQILVVIAWDSAAADSVATAWEGIDAATRADTIVYVVVTDGEDEPIYFE